MKRRTRLGVMIAAALSSAQAATVKPTIQSISRVRRPEKTSSGLLSITNRSHDPLQRFVGAVTNQFWIAGFPAVPRAIILVKHWKTS